MTARDRLSLMVLVTSIALALAALATHGYIERSLLPEAGSAHADQIEVVVATPLPMGGEPVDLVITDTRMDAWSIDRVSVRRGGRELDFLSFDTGTTATARVVMPLDVDRGRLPLDVIVAYSSYGPGGVRRQSAVGIDLDVRVYSASERLQAQLRIAVQAWGMFLIWFFVVLAVARRYMEAAQTNRDVRHVIPLVIGYAVSGILGDVLLARPLLLGLGHDSFDARVPVIGLWLGLPLIWLALQALRRPAREPWLPGARLRQRTR